MTSVPIFNVVILAHLQDGTVIIIMDQYEYNRKGKTINFSVHLEWYNNIVNEYLRKENGSEQWMLTHKGYPRPPLYFHKYYHTCLCTPITERSRKN